jgi:Family of unknown function (DUF5670)
LALAELAGRFNVFHGIYFVGVKAMRVVWAIAGILLVLWIVGFALHVAGSLIHILLLVAVVILIIDLLSGSRRPV